MVTTTFTLFAEIIFNHISFTQTMKIWIEKCSAYQPDQNVNSHVSIVKSKIILSCFIAFIKSYKYIETTYCYKSQSFACLPDVRSTHKCRPLGTTWCRISAFGQRGPQHPTALKFHLPLTTFLSGIRTTQSGGATSLMGIIPVGDLSWTGQRVRVTVFKQDFGCSLSRASLVLLSQLRAQLSSRNP